MDDADIGLRNATYRRFVELGRAPSAAELASSIARPVDFVREGWRRLHDAHALVLDGDRSALRMLNPFSMEPTDFVVEAGGRSWYANCAWDAFGIGAALDVDTVIETTCPDCRTPIRVTVVDGRPDDEHPVFHCLVPAVSWWQDIGFT